MAISSELYMMNWLADFTINQGSQPNEYDMIEAGWPGIEVNGYNFDSAVLLAVRLFGVDRFITSRLTRQLWFENELDLLMFTLAFDK
jgi:hypothetical protein